MFDDDLELDEFYYYLQNYRLLDADMDEIINLLPDPRSDQYEEIIHCLEDASLKDIQEMKDLALEEGTYDSLEVQSFIKQEEDKLEILHSLLEKDEEHSLEENKLYLIPNKNGRIRVLDDLDRIPVDYYDEVSSLMQSIVDGTFKRVKKFNKSSDLNVAGISEVRGHKVRILFDRIDHNTYAIITTFLKKADNEKIYREFIRCRIAEYRLNENKYKKAVLDSELMNLNEEYVNELWDKLGETREKSSKIKELN